MGWKKTTLREISENIQTGPFGSQLHSSDYSEIGTPVVMPKDLSGGHISEDTIARVSSSHVSRLARHKIEKNDIIYSRRGDVGKCALATGKEKGWLCGTGCLRVTVDIEKASPKYIFYQLQQPQTVGWVENHAVGSTMKNLNTTILGNIPLEIPSLAHQNRVVSILSSYDDLIENNQKQIKLLEEAAQRLYKEWFVDLRFPGHENVNIVDGVPEGWHYGIINEIASFRRGKTITKAHVKDGVVPVVAGGIEPAYYHNIANTAAPVVTVSASGANAGFTRLYSVDVFASDCSFVDSTITPHLLFVYLFLKNNKASLESLQKGSAQPHVYAKDINALSILVPPNSVMEQFTEICSHLFRKVQLLEKQVIMVQEARDRLLPKLISGEIMI